MSVHKLTKKEKQYISKQADVIIQEVNEEILARMVTDIGKYIKPTPKTDK